MLAASKVKMNGSDKKKRTGISTKFFVSTYHIFSIERVSRKFTLQQQRQRNSPQSVLNPFLFLLIEPINYFAVLIPVAF